MVCDRVAIIHQGKLLAVGTIKELTSGENVRIEAENIKNGTVGKLKELFGEVQVTNTRVTVPSASAEKVNDAIDLIRGAGGTIVSVVPHRRTLEEVFVETVMKAGGTVSPAEMRDSEA